MRKSQVSRSGDTESRILRSDAMAPAASMIVGIDEPQVIAAGVLQQGIAGRGESAIARMPEQAKRAAEARRMSAMMAALAIGGGIV